MPDDENSTTNTSLDVPAQPRTEQPSPVTFPDQVQSQPRAEVVSAPVAPPKSVNTPGVLVLQWLTYAFWGWTLVALYWLTGLVVQYFIREPNNSYDSSYDYMGEMVAYSLAAVVVLLIISMVCDFFYSKFEPRAKTGAAMVIMIIHAVIFALCAIGSVIVAVFAVVNMMISGGSEGATTALIAASVMSLLYAATLVRTLHPVKVLHSTKAHWLIMIVAVVVISGLGIFGPAVAAQRVKDDLVLESGLGDVADAIKDYTSQKGKLPSNLNDSELRKSYSISSNEDAAHILNENLVEYTPGKKVSNDTDLMSTLNDSGVSVRSYDPDATKSAVYQYRLCVNYDNEKRGYSSDYDYDYGYSRSSAREEYPINPNTSSHSAGKVCYDLQTGYSN